MIPAVSRFQGYSAREVRARGLDVPGHVPDFALLVSDDWETVEGKNPDGTCLVSFRAVNPRWEWDVDIGGPATAGLIHLVGTGAGNPFAW